MNMDTKSIYLDHSATTYVKKEVIDEMLPYFTEGFGNPSSIYKQGRDAKKAIENSREIVATTIGASAREIFFTASGSESDNWAIKGAAYANVKKGKHIITSQIEHSAVLNACKQLESEGFKVSYLPVDSDGLVNVDNVEKAITPETILISIMYANNEIGTIQPIADIGKLAKSRGVIFHTDAVQAIGNIPVNVNDLNVDLLSLTAHKFYGPKGIGALYVRKGIKISSLIHGGHQERGKRAGTENVPSIVGMAKALKLATDNIESYNSKLLALRDRTIDEIMEKIPFVRLNGDRNKRLPGNVNLSFQYIEGESLLLMLDMKGIAASSGSACTSGSLDPSHVLLAIGLPHEIAHGSLRLTYGESNTDEDVTYLINTLIPIVNRLREMSPLYNAIK
jgi:cysteine desulfurase